MDAFILKRYLKKTGRMYHAYVEFWTFVAFQGPISAKIKPLTALAVP